eukprot:tig00000658_g2909.t1
MPFDVYDRPWQETDAMSLISFDDASALDGASQGSASPTTVPISGPPATEFADAVEAVAVPAGATLRGTFPKLTEAGEADILRAVRSLHDVMTVRKASPDAAPSPAAAPPPTPPARPPPSVVTASLADRPAPAPEKSTDAAPGTVPNAEEEWQELLKKIPELGSHPSITTEQKAELHALLRRYKDVFADKVEAKEGTSNLLYYEHVIRLTSRLPVFTPPRRMNPHAEEHARKEIQKLLELGLIEPSQAAYGSPVVLAPKKDGTWRFCVDYRRLNQITERDVFPLPRIDDQLERLRGSMVFSTADATAGFWQLPLHPGSRAYTAFVVPWGHFQWRVTPFGVTNGPAAFSRAITAILGPLLTTCVVAYIDDITVFSPSIDQHLLDLKALFETISKANLRLKPSKCRFCVPEIDLLGHRISAEGIRQDPAKTKVISDWQTPKNADELRSFLGLAGYYRRFVENFSKVVYAMQRLLLKDAVWSWPEGGAADRAFKELKELLGRDIILRFPDFSKPFILQTDASTYAIGAILSQTDKDGVERPLAFISRTLLPAEMNYSATELECLAVVWAIKYWRHYLLGGPQFLVRTDHHALQWLKSLDPTTGRLGRWSLLLQAYDFDIVYRPGKQNGGPDACSRLPNYKDHPVWQPGGADGSSSTPAAYKGAEGFGVPQQAVGAEPEDPDVPLGIFRVQLGPTERALRKLADSAGFQGAVPAGLDRSGRRRGRPPVDEPSPAAVPAEPVGRSSNAEEESRPPEPAPAPASRRRGPRELAKLAASAGYAEAKASATASDDESRKRARAVPERFAPRAPESPSPPPAKRDRRPATGPGAGSDSDVDMPDAPADNEDGAPPALLESAHAEAAAADSESEVSPEAEPDAECDADGFPLALLGKLPPRAETGPRRWDRRGFAEPRPVHPSGVLPRGMYASIARFVDIFHLDMHEDGLRYIIAYVDAYTKFCYIYPLARVSGEALLATAIDFYMHEGVPARILTDRGSQLVGGLWNEFFKEKGTRFVHAAAYHHATNGGAERLGGVYKTLAYAMCREHKRPLSDWPLYNADIVLALRTTVHSATGVRFASPDHTHPADYLLAMTRAAASVDAASREYRRFYRNRMVARTGDPPHRRRFQVGDKVLCWMGDHDKGLYNSWVGPYTVTGVNPGGYTYTVKGSAKPYSTMSDTRVRPLRETVATSTACFLSGRASLSRKLVPLGPAA